MPHERTPLLQSHQSDFWSFGQSSGQSQDHRAEYHAQFCKLVGIPPSDLPAHESAPRIPPKSLYGRALKARGHQSMTYSFTAGISNTLLLSQVVLGAAVTGLGASESSHILITIFGALNTIIAGVVAYLKSRGQPMRARMYRDDLERVVDEIENSEVMWLGISKGVHGYDEININEDVTVRSEVARLTRLYERAVRTNTVNNPDMYMAGAMSDTGLALKARAGGPVPPAPVLVQAPNPTSPPAPGGAPPIPVAGPAAAIMDPDESPASAPKKPSPPPTIAEPPKTEPPKEDPPKVEAPKVEAPKEDPPKVEAPKEDPPKDATLPNGIPASTTTDPAKDAVKAPEEAPKEDTPAPASTTPVPAQAPTGTIDVAGQLADDEPEPASAPTHKPSPPKP